MKAAAPILDSMFFWNLNRKQKLRRLAVSLWTTPLVMGSPLLWLAYLDPTILLDFAAFYALFFGLPLVAALFLYWRAAKVNPSGENVGS